MTKNKSRIHLSSEDFNRILITDTQPFHVPIIFDNYGFYQALKSLGKQSFYETMPKSLLKALTGKENQYDFKGYSIPFSYQISKNIHSCRQLSLVHPLHQLEIVSFYKKYYAIILYNCTRSEFSLRYPKNINSTVYRLRNQQVYDDLSEKNLLNDYETDLPDLSEESDSLEFASSFFAYNKFDFIYKFYDSIEFLKLEKKFLYLKMLDVSKCFDSIYTHSIAWAIKEKHYIKDNLNRGIKDGSFEDTFDSLMQNMNYRETNGIVIGAEVSRIFAELIFQRIDFNIKKSLENEHSLYHNKDYAIRRYVDDYCIFFSKKEHEILIVEIISNKLKEYNLSLNPAKIKDFQRPFVTPRTRNIAELRRYLNESMSEILIKNEDNFHLPNAKFLKHPIHKASRFIKDIKSYWHNEGDFETGFSGYLLTALNVQLVTFQRQYKNIPENAQGYENSVINFLLFIFEVSLYSFTLDPNVTNSTTFARIILFIDRFITQNRNLINYQEKLRHPITISLIGLLDNELNSLQASQIERLNILLVLHILDRKILEKMDDITVEYYIFGKNFNEINYFSLIVSLFIFRNKSHFEILKINTIDKIKERLKELKGIKHSSEAFHLYFDCMSCPFLNDSDKLSITKVVLNFHQISQNNLTSTAKDWIDFSKNKNWFVKWNEVDFLNYLRRKQLRDAY